MSTHEPLDSSELLELACQGDDAALGQLLADYRGRLRRMVEVHIDSRLAARLDASDVVQDTIAEATRRMTDFAEQRPMPFYAWLRRLAWQRMQDLHRRHVRAEKRSVLREQALLACLPDQSSLRLADCLAIGRELSPSRQLIQREQKLELYHALAEMNAGDRELLVMIYLEQMTIGEVAAVLGITAKATQMRHLRAIDRLRRHISE